MGLTEDMFEECTVVVTWERERERGEGGRLGRRLGVGR